LRTADGRGIVFQFVDDWANYVRFFRSDGFTNYLMQSPNMRYMDARDWGGTWAMLVQQNDGGNQIFFPAAYSDERLKTNIAPTQVDALAAIAAVEVVEYDWNEDGLTLGHMHSELKHVEIGVIGQQAVEHVPEMFEAGPVRRHRQKRATCSTCRTRVSMRRGNTSQSAGAMIADASLQQHAPIRCSRFSSLRDTQRRRRLLRCFGRRRASASPMA
jgi:hypothetical protein